MYAMARPQAVGSPRHRRDGVWRARDSFRSREPEGCRWGRPQGWSSKTCVCLNFRDRAILRRRRLLPSTLYPQPSAGRNRPITGARIGSTYLKPGQAMVTKEDIEGFLDRISAAEGASYREVEPGLWIVKPGGELDFSLVVNYSPPVVIMRVNVMTLPKDESEL